MKKSAMKDSSIKDPQSLAQQGRMVLKQLSPDFLDPAHEWRRIFAETWGTFLLVLVAAGGGVAAARSGGTVTLGMQVAAPGLMVMAIIYFMGTVSGAHLNPAVTLAFAVRRNFPWRRVPAYVLAQLFGAVMAAQFLQCAVRLCWRAGRDPAGQRYQPWDGIGDRSGADRGAGEHDPGHGFGRAQHRHQWRHCGGRIHHSGRSLGVVVQRCFDEPGAILCSRPGARRPEHDVDLHRRAGAGRADRRRFRMDTQRQAYRCRSDCGSRIARYR